MKVTDVMTSNVEWCKPESTIQDAAMTMQSLDVGAVPVCDSGNLVGLVTDRDVALKGVANGVPFDAPVSQVMCADVVTGNPQMSVGEAADLMAENQIRRLPICKDEELVGIVSLGDLAVNEATTDSAGRALEDISYPAKPDLS